MTTHPQNGLGEPAGAPGLGIILSACALVITAHLLGAAFLSETVLGLPAGLWIIGLSLGILSRRARTAIARNVERLWTILDPSSPAPAIVAPASPTQASGWWPATPVLATVADCVTRAAFALARLALLPLWRTEFSFSADARRTAEDWFGHLPWPTRPLRVGLHMPDDEAAAVTAAEGAARVEWFRLPAWDDPQALCRRHLFDAVVFHDGESPVRIVTLERPGLPAGVVEWADLRAPLTVASLFPARIDPAAVVIEGATRTKVREGADLLRALVEAAATLSRSTPRIGLADRLLGRRPTDAIDRPGGLSLWRSARSTAATVMANLADAAHRRAHAWPEAAALATDVAGAFFISCDGLEPPERLESLSNGPGPEIPDATLALRLAAASIGAFDDERGLEHLVRADALIRAGGTTLAPLDHAAFLESELVHGTDDPMSVGRAAAAICMVCAVTPPDRLPFVRDDMLEEMAYAGWLVGRDQDRGLLIAVFLEIEHAHAAASADKAARRKRVRTRARQGRAAAA